MKMGFAEGHLWQVEFALGESCGWRTIEDISIFVSLLPSFQFGLFFIFYLLFLFFLLYKFVGPSGPFIER
jgi:hypothetical protein